MSEKEEKLYAALSELYESELESMRGEECIGENMGEKIYYFGLEMFCRGFFKGFKTSIA